MKKIIILILICVCIVNNLYSQLGDPVAVVVDSPLTQNELVNNALERLDRFAYRATQIGTVLQIADNGVRYIDNQVKSFKALEKGDLEGFSDFLRYQAYALNVQNASLGQISKNRALSENNTKYLNEQGEQLEWTNVNEDTQFYYENADGELVKDVNFQPDRAVLNSLSDSLMAYSRYSANMDNYIESMERAAEELENQGVLLGSSTTAIQAIQTLGQMTSLSVQQNELLIRATLETKTLIATQYAAQEQRRQMEDKELTEFFTPTPDDEKREVFETETNYSYEEVLRKMQDNIGVMSDNNQSRQGR